ncbi:hypothetical protein PHLCEN_2v592 [Hermanssonia centrifuga]|uniref:Uncharacterized protein n=1 Tax=Hermanssonia centrifuga TaxID=98765 RepID=A0A2R6S5N8_9APHY|nr:hypothetical protein PHLCEN_2v592 [Hermanssonia centrifuga]
MADVEPQNPEIVDESRTDEGAAAQEDNNTCSTDGHPEEHGEHDASDQAEPVAEDAPASVLSDHAEDNAAVDHGEKRAVEVPDIAPPADSADATQQKAPKATPPVSPAKSKHTSKPSISVKPAGAKTASAPPTPLVKKIINSGTFGSGAVKAAPAAAVTKATATTGTTSKPTPSAPIRKVASTSSAVSNRASMPPPPTKAPTGSSATPSAPARRASLLPGARTATTAPGPSKAATPPVSTTAKPPPARASVASPDSASSVRSAATPRPRASVTEGAKRTAPAPRFSLGPSASSRPPSTASTRPARTAGSPSIGSIKELKDDTKAVDDLQNKLSEATASLTAKGETIAELEGQVATLKSSLDETQAELTAKLTAAGELEQAKAASEQELATLRESLQQLKDEHGAVNSRLEAVQEELATAKAANSEQTELVKSLQAQIESLGEQVEAAKANLEAIRSSSGETETVAAVAAVEHEALLKAKEDLEAIQHEVSRLEEEHAGVLAESQEKISTLEAQLARVAALEQELAEVKADRDAQREKASEIELELLEVKDAEDKASDDVLRVEARLKSLQQELDTAIADAEAAATASAAREEEFAQKAEAAAKSHAEELSNAALEYEKLSAALKALEDKVAQAHADNEQLKADALAVAEEQRASLAELEKGYQAKEAELASEIERITSELQGQESAYNAKVDAVQAEHSQLLQEAFTKAKSEAGTVHSQDLQALRGESQAAIEQLRVAHQSTVDNLRAEHQAVLDHNVKALEKQLTSQALELNAAREDLAKAKAAYSTLIQESQTAKAQLEEARQLIASLDKSDKDEVIARLNKDLANARQEHEVLSDMLQATNDSIREITDNHTRELEETAKGRAEEATKLRTAHEEELSVLTKDRAELTTRLSDLQGELATLKATLSDPHASPRSNGTTHARSSSVTREDLQKMHEAHNLKLYDLQAEHDRAMRTLKDELEVALAKADGLNQEIQRKNMEIEYLETDQEESTDTITRYVRIFGFKSFLAGAIALAVIYGLF